MPRSIASTMSDKGGSDDERDASDAEVNGNSARILGPIDAAEDADLFGSSSDAEGPG